MFILPEGDALARARQLSDDLRAVIYVADAATMSRHSSRPTRSSRAISFACA